MRIDAHHHFWNYNADEYAWLDGPMESLKRDFTPTDLKPLLDAAGINAVVSIEARQTEIETAYLLNHASQNDWIAGVVGYIPLESPTVRVSLERFTQNRHFRGVRKVLQGQPEGCMRGDDFNRGIAHLKHFNIAYDILIFAKQIPEAVELVDRHPQQIFVLDHLAKPRIEDGGYEPWAGDIRRLAERPNVYCKISGMVTEADWKTWSPSTLQPYFDATIDTFGPNRLMFGSDWPVATVASEYSRWVDTVKTWTAALSETEQERLWAGTAIEAYRLVPTTAEQP